MRKQKRKKYRHLANLFDAGKNQRLFWLMAEAFDIVPLVPVHDVNLGKPWRRHDIQRLNSQEINIY